MRAWGLGERLAGVAGGGEDCGSSWLPLPRARRRITRDAGRKKECGGPVDGGPLLAANMAQVHRVVDLLLVGGE